MIIGVDPGKNGGIFWINPNSSLHYRIMPDFDFLDYWHSFGIGILQKLERNEIKVYLEDVHSIYGSSAKSNFQFGRAVGFIEGFFAGLGIPVVKVTPKNWQSVMFDGIPVIKKKDSGKNDTKAMALEALKLRHPECIDWFKITPNGNRSKNVHDGLVDAALIALYGLEQERCI